MNERNSQRLSAEHNQKQVERLDPRIAFAVVLAVVLIASGVAGAPSASEYTNTDDNEEASHERRVFVCMTGQTQRAELEQKIDNLFRPLQNHSSEVVIGLVLETPRQPQFVYSDFGCIKGEFASPKDLKNELSHRGFNASAVDRIERAPDSAKNSEAFRVMMNRLVNLRNEERHIAYLRMKMHLSQWEKLWTCNTLMEQQERERGKNFSHVFRLREDGVPPYTVDVETLLSAPENSAKNTVGTCMCECMLIILVYYFCSDSTFLISALMLICDCLLHLLQRSAG
jgi:hypothetical protein